LGSCIGISSTTPLSIGNGKYHEPFVEFLHQKLDFCNIGVKAEVFINVTTKEYNDTTKATNIITHKFAQNGVSDYKKGQIVRTLLGVFRNQENMKSERNKRNRVIKFLAKVSKPAVKKTRSGKSSVILPTGLHHHQYSMRTFPTAAVGAAYLKLLGPNDVVVYMTATGEKYVRVVQAVNTGVTTYSGETADNTQQVSFITLLNPNDTKASWVFLCLFSKNKPSPICIPVVWSIPIL
jgi:hypothetical protein